MFSSGANFVCSNSTPFINDIEKYHNVIYYIQTK